MMRKPPGAKREKAGEQGFKSPRARHLLGLEPEILARARMRVILDKDGIAAQLRTVISSIENPTPRPPTQHEFLEVVSDFYNAVFTAKHLRRGELWWTVACLNFYMQMLLLRITEWHARATHGWNYDTWFRGRFLEEWTHPQALKELRGAFARAD